MGAAEWSEKNLRLPPSEAQRDGPLDLDQTPWMREPIDAFDDPEVSRISLCTSAQSAKTTGMRCMMARGLTNNPGPSLMVLPNEKIAKKFSRKRWRPFVEISPALNAIKPSKRDEFSLLEQHFATASMLIVGSNSAANLSSEPVKYLFLDEVDKYPRESDVEGDPVSLAIERLRTFDESKCVEASTPTIKSGQIWQSLMRSDWRRYYVPCPRCEVPFSPTWRDFWWPSEAKHEDGYDLEMVLDATRLICPTCDGEIENHEKPEMVQAGIWKPTKKGSPGHRGYHFPAFMALWSSCDWGKLAVKFLEAKPNPRALRNVVNSTFAEIWEQKGQVTDADTVLEHRLEYPMQTCPVVPLRIFMTIDVQKDCYYYVVRAWCRHETSYQVEHGQVETLQELDEVSKRTYPVPHGRRGIDKVYIDSGNDTVSVYRIARQRRWKCTKGDKAYAGVSPIKPGKGKDGTKILMYSASSFKEDLQERLAIKPGEPGAWYLSAGTTREFAKQLAGEEEIEIVDKHGHEKPVWKKIYANHLLDCEVMQLVAAETNQIAKMQTPPARAEANDRRSVPRSSRIHQLRKSLGAAIAGRTRR